MLRKFAVVLFALILVFGMVTSAWAAGIKITVDGVQLTDAEPFTTEGRTMVPFRVIGESVSARVDYEPVAKKVKLVKGDKTIVLTLGSKQASVNGEARTLDVAAVAKNGKTYIPARFVTEELGCSVAYKNGVVSVVTPDDGSMAYLLEASEAYLDLDSVKFAGNLDGTVKVDANGTTQSTGMDMAMSGWFQNPDKVYMKMDVSADNQTESVEMYMAGAKMYMKQGDAAWTVADVPGMSIPGMDMSNPSFFTQNPEQAAELVKKLGIKTYFAEDEPLNGENCKVITYTMGKDQFFNAMNVLLGEFAEQDPDLSSAISGDMDQVMALMQTMVERLNVDVKIYIAEDSALMLREEINMRMVMGGALLGGGMDMTMTGAIDFTDYNGKVTPPDVSGAVAAE